MTSLNNLINYPGLVASGNSGFTISNINVDYVYASSFIGRTMDNSADVTPVDIADGRLTHWGHRGNDPTNNLSLSNGFDTNLPCRAIFTNGPNGFNTVVNVTGSGWVYLIITTDVVRITVDGFTRILSPTGAGQDEDTFAVLGMGTNIGSQRVDRSVTSPRQQLILGNEHIPGPNMSPVAKAMNVYAVDRAGIKFNSSLRVEFFNTEEFRLQQCGVSYVFEGEIT